MGLREIYLTLVYLSFFAIGVTAPFVFSLGYVWVDIFYPQALSTTLASVPIAMLMGCAAILFYCAADRKNPAFSAHTVLVVLMAIWISLTMLWAEAPELAAAKYSWASKTVLFSAFLPFVFRSRVQIEAFLCVFTISLVSFMLPVAVKSLVSGSSYGQTIGLSDANFGLGESSTLATICAAIIPIMLWLRQHSLLLPKGKLRSAALLGLSLLSVFGGMGTFARTGIISFGVLAVDMLMRTKRKVLFLSVIGVVGACAYYTASSGWDKRMETIETYQQESSAYTRILVWEWTLGYVATHPFGGGFNDFVISRVEYPPTADRPEPLIEVGHAFHSSYFEVLGEHGIPGIALFLGLVALCIVWLRNVRRSTKKLPHMLWAYDLAGALRASLLVTMAGSAFVGIAFQPPFWYFFAIIAALRHHVLIVVNKQRDLRLGVNREASRGLIPARALSPVARLAR